MGRSLDKFEKSARPGFLLKSRIIFWHLGFSYVFESVFSPVFLKTLILRMFGGKIGRDSVLKSGIKLHFPWNLEVGDNCWIGEEVWFINHKKILIGSNVCISQRSIICSSGHNYRSASLEYAHKPIEIKDGAWICLDSKVLPGVTIGECSVVSAGEIARKSVPDFTILIDGEIKQIDPPK